MALLARRCLTGIRIIEQRATISPQAKVCGLFYSGRDGYLTSTWPWYETHEGKKIRASFPAGCRLPLKPIPDYRSRPN